MSPAYDVAGTGEPLLLIQGLGYGRTGWGPAPARLAQRFKVVTFDNRFGSLVNIGFWAVLLLLPGLIGAVVGEFISANRGLGYLVTSAAAQFNTTGTMAAILALLLIVAVMDLALTLAERRLLRWRPRPAASVADDGRPVGMGLRFLDPPLGVSLSIGELLESQRTGQF